MKPTCVGIWQGTSTEIWTHQSLIRGTRLCWVSVRPAGDGDTGMHSLSLSPWLHKHTSLRHTHPHPHTYTHRHAVFFGRIIACHPRLSSHVSVSLAPVLARLLLVASGKVRVAVSALSHWAWAGQTQQAPLGLSEQARSTEAGVFKQPPERSRPVCLAFVSC